VGIGYGVCRNVHGRSRPQYPVYLSSATRDCFSDDSSIIAWVNIVYFVVSLSLTLTLAKVGDALGRKRVFLIGLGFFSGGLAVAALSQSATQLILARVIQRWP
jgi:MFS family permease